MSKLTMTTLLTLDAVMQGPGRPDEDQNGGFTHGGWMVPMLTAAALNSLPKYVMATTLDDVRWNNSTLVRDVVGETAKLKQRYAREIQVHGSCGLAQTLIAK